MVKKVSAKKFDAAGYRRFITVAENFDDAALLAEEFEYFNSSGVLYILSAIAYADALTIKLTGKKSSGDNHYNVIHLMEETVPSGKINKKAMDCFKSLIDHKNLISYTGDVYRKKDILKIRRLYGSFKEWVVTLLT
ncbi:MAG: hypothetical protein IPM56_15865 [Ignavibacteriales bacterium]|nr:MAG: hypothetical protein IPM56_15865 [Ignavibacteriales bacterium]